MFDHLRGGGGLSDDMDDVASSSGRAGGMGPRRLTAKLYLVRGEAWQKCWDRCCRTAAWWVWSREALMLLLLSYFNATYNLQVYQGGSTRADSVTITVRAPDPVEVEQVCGLGLLCCYAKVNQSAAWLHMLFAPGRVVTV